MLDCLYDEKPTEELDFYLCDANPSVFTDSLSADPAIWEDFKVFLVREHFSVSLSEKETYDLAQKYLKTGVKVQYGDFSELFAEIELEEWGKLCRIVVDGE
ncbi:MAG: hypothetical protein Q4C70_11965 [Planctomycetia bacterium]|nr:hypothetical protein [Planctomycetia bacterium]